MIQPRFDLSRRFVQKLYRWAKHDSSYLLPNHYTSAILLGELSTRAVMALRGTAWRWRLRRARGIVFIGKDVRIRAPEALSLGNSVVFHDHVTIDALSRNGIVMGDNVTIREYCTLECTGVLRFPGEGLTIGDNTGIAQFGFIAARGPVKIGNNVQIGPRVTIYAENHNFDDLDRPIRDQGVRRQGITIEDDCWLGSGCTILDGVTVGKGSVIAAGCVVTKNVLPYSVVAGIPGRLLRKRGSSALPHLT
jgi:acetyltransferase-like isoleucine patch superfamily enzyme